MKKILKTLLKEFDKVALKNLRASNFLFTILILIAIPLCFNFVLNIPLYIFGLGYIFLGIPLQIRRMYLIRKKLKEKK